MLFYIVCFVFDEFSSLPIATPVFTVVRKIFYRSIGIRIFNLHLCLVLCALLNNYFASLI